MEPSSAPSLNDKPPLYSLHSTETTNSYQSGENSSYTQQPANAIPSFTNGHEHTPLISSSYPPKYSANNVTIQNNPLLYVGGCPVCRVGVIETDYPCLAICCAIVFFPLGILCCLSLRQKRCSNCGHEFDE